MFCDSVFFFWKCIVWFWPKHFYFLLQIIFLMTHFSSNHYRKYSWQSPAWCIFQPVLVQRNNQLWSGVWSDPHSACVTFQSYINKQQVKTQCSRGKSLPQHHICKGHVFVSGCLCVNARAWTKEINLILTYKSVFSRMRK